MAMQTTGPISFGNVQTEHGGSNPITLSEYRGVGGGAVSGPMALSDFYGTSGSVFCHDAEVWQWRHGGADPTGIRSRTYTFSGKPASLGNAGNTLFLAVVVTYPSTTAQPVITPLLRRLNTAYPNQNFSLVGVSGNPLTGGFGGASNYTARTAVYIFQSPNDSNTPNLWNGGNDISITVNSDQDMYGLAWRLYSATANNIFLRDIQGTTDATTSNYAGSSITLSTDSNSFIISAECLYATWGGGTMMTGWSSQWGGGGDPTILRSESYFNSSRDLFRLANLQQYPSAPSHTVTLAYNTAGSPYTGHRSTVIAACFSGNIS